MFGYVKPYAPNLLVREYDYFRCAYCGLCRTMRRHTGQLSALSLSYDCLLLALVRMLYAQEKQTAYKKRRCIAHPLKRRPMLEETPELRFAAEVSALLSYYKIKDELTDQKGFRRGVAFCGLPIFSHAKRKGHLPALAALMEADLLALAKKEEEKCPSVDECAEIFGHLLGAVFAYEKEGSDALVLSSFGRSLGRFIYIADAAEDYDKDAKSGAYNPFCLTYNAAPLTPEQKQMIHTALLCELKGLENAMNLLPTENNDALIHIIENTVCEGLVRRIAFLLDGKEESPEPPIFTETPSH